MYLAAIFYYYSFPFHYTVMIVYSHSFVSVSIYGVSVNEGLELFIVNADLTVKTFEDGSPRLDPRVDGKAANIQ